MVEDLPSLKAATIERGSSRVREEDIRASNTFAADRPVQDFAILSSLRAFQATLDTGQHVIHRERLGAPQGIVDRAHAPAWALIPAAPAAGRKASKARVPTLERRSHQTDHADYATCIDGQWYRLSKKQKSRNYRLEDGLQRSLIIYRSFLKARKAVHSGLSKTHQYAILQNPIQSLLNCQMEHKPIWMALHLHQR